MNAREVKARTQGWLGWSFIHSFIHDRQGCHHAALTGLELTMQQAYLELTEIHLPPSLKSWAHRNELVAHKDSYFFSPFGHCTILKKLLVEECTPMCNFLHVFSVGDGTSTSQHMCTVMRGQL